MSISNIIYLKMGPNIQICSVNRDTYFLIGKASEDLRNYTENEKIAAPLI